MGLIYNTRKIMLRWKVRTIDWPVMLIFEDAEGEGIGENEK